MIMIFVVWEGEDGGKEMFNVVIIHGDGWVGGILYSFFFSFFRFFLGGGLLRWGLHLFVRGGNVGGLTSRCVCLGCHYSPRDGIRDEDSICNICISLAHPLSGECKAKRAKFFCLCRIVNGIM